MKHPYPIRQSRRASLRLPEDFPSAMPIRPVRLLGILALLGAVLAVVCAVSLCVFQIQTLWKP